MEGEKNTGTLILKFVAMALMLLVFLLAHIWVRTQFVTESFRLTSLRSELRQLEALRAEEQVRLDSLLDPRNLENLNLRKRWGLQEALPHQVFYVNSVESP